VQGAERVAGHPRHDSASDRGRSRQQQRFDDALPDDAAPAGAQRQSQREVAAARIGARNQQRRHVHARRREHETAEGQEEQKRHALRTPGFVVALGARLDQQPHIVGAVGFHAAIDWTQGIGLDALHAHESALVSEARTALRTVPGVTLFGPEDSAGIVSFAMNGVHPHDIGTILDDATVAVRAGHHCAQPLMDYLGVPATARASFAAHSDADDIEALVQGLYKVKRIFG